MRGKTIKFFTVGSIKRPKMFTVSNNKNNDRQVESKEKQVRKIGRKKNKEE